MSQASLPEKQIEDLYAPDRGKYVTVVCCYFYHPRKN